MDLTNRTQAGFSMLEVMIGSLILLAGITGFATMQTSIMQSDKSIELRALAIQIAKQKMQQLRHFERIQKTDNKLNYQTISNDTGGVSAAGEIEIVENQNTNSTVKFEQHWSVVDQYYIDSNNDGNADKWVASDDPNAPNPLPKTVDRKAVIVSVSWLDNDDKKENYELLSYIAPIPIDRSIHVFNQTSDVDLKPETLVAAERLESMIQHTLTPDIVQANLPFESDPIHKTTKFSSVKFVASKQAEAVTLVQKNEFVFSQCQCTLAGNKLGKTPAKTVIKNGHLETIKGSWQTKTTGAPKPNQSPLCDSCCRDHHDTQQMLENQNYYRQQEHSPHLHFKLVNDNEYISAINIGDHYDEVCRFQRIDGLFELVPDLQSVKTITVATNQINAQFSEQYQQYVSDIVKNSILEKPLPQSPLEKKLIVSPSATQLTLRSIYLERLSQQDTAKIKQMIGNNNSAWRELTPFFDVDVTLQAQWDSSNDTIARVTNQPLETEFSPPNFKFATYSRGRLVASVNGNSQISNVLINGNEGFIGSKPISPFNQQQKNVSHDLQVQIQDINGPTVGLAIDVLCVYGQNDNQRVCNNEQYAELTKLKITANNEQASCNIEVLPSANTSFINCAGITKNWQGNIFVNSDMIQSKLQLYWKDPNNQLLLGPTLELSAPLDKTSNGDYWLIVEVEN